MLDCRKALGAVGAHKRAFGNRRTADAPGDRSLDLGIVEIELRGGESCLRDGDIGIGLGKGCHGIVELLAAGEILVAQLRLPVGLLARLKLDGLCALQRALGARDLNAKRRRIDPVEHVALFHVAALLEHAFSDDAGNARTHLGDAGRRNAPGQFVQDRDRPRRHVDHAHRRWRRGRLGRARAFGVTAGCDQRKKCDRGCDFQGKGKAMHEAKIREMMIAGTSLMSSRSG